MTRLIAVTGGSGFIGRHLLPLLAAEGRQVRALMRRAPESAIAPGIEIVRGALDDRASLDRLVAGADAVVHLAGAIAATGRAGFMAANRDGSAGIAAAAAATGRTPRFVQVSSLAAREPGLSAYAASKRAGEDEALRHGSGLDLVLVRPPAIYGPGDQASMPLFRGIDRGILPVPAVPDARFSLLFVLDLAQLLHRLATGDDRPGTAPLEPDDGTTGGYGWNALAAIARRVTGRRLRLLRLPRALLTGPAWLAESAGRLLGRPPFLSREKLAELFHPDWVCRPATLAGVPGWKALTGFESGCARTLAWYKDHHWRTR